MCIRIRDEIISISIGKIVHIFMIIIFLKKNIQFASRIIFYTSHPTRTYINQRVV